MTTTNQAPGPLTRPRRMAGPALVGVVLALALAACGSANNSGTYDGQVVPQPAGAEGGAPADAPADAKVSMTIPAQTDAQIIRTAYLTLRVADVSAGVRQITTATTAIGGSVTDQQVTGQGDAINASLTVKVPATKLDGYLEAVQALGTVDAVSISATDVTAQAVDLDARIAALQASIRRLAALMDQASNVTDLVAIEAEQTRRQADLDSLVAQRTALGDQVAMSNVSITLSPIVAGSSWVPPGFGPGLAAGWAALVSLGGVLVTTAGFLVPFLVVLAIIAAIVIPISLRLVRRRRASR